MKTKWPTKMSTRLLVDYNRSHNSYMVDINGKSYLDMFGSISSLPLGYNHQSLVNLVKTTDPSLLIHKPATGIFPPKRIPEIIKRHCKIINIAV